MESMKRKLAMLLAVVMLLSTVGGTMALALPDDDSDVDVEAGMHYSSEEGAAAELPAEASDETETVPPENTEVSLSQSQEDWLDKLDFDNVVAMARELSEYPFGSRVGGSWRMDMTVEFLMDQLEEWGYDPWIHHFDTRDPHLNNAGNMVPSPNRRFNNGWVEVAGSKFMLYGPAFAADTVYTWAHDAENDFSITANAAGSVFLDWPSIPFSGNMNIGGQGGRPSTQWGHVTSDYYVAGGPTATSAAEAFPMGSFLAHNDLDEINVTGKVVFVQLGSGATPHAAGMWHPPAAQVHETVLALQEAGAVAVVFQSRPSRAMFISGLTPFYNVITDRETWTEGDSVHGRLANQTTGTPITIPVGLTSHWQTSEAFDELTGNEPVEVFMQARSDGQNVLAEWTSSNPDAKNIYIASHPDSVVSAPGFNDTIITTALAMEFMRVLAEYEIELEHNIRFAAWDFEENGLLGARYYVTDMDQATQEDFWGVFNLDMVASGQPELNYIHVNITTPTFAQADATAATEAPVGNFQFYLRQIQDNQRLRDHTAAYAYASQFGVWASAELAVRQLAADGRHEDRDIIVDPTHHRFGEPFDIDYHFTFTWGQTTDQAPFVHAGLTGVRHEHLLNAMQFDWRANARGFVGGQFPTGWQPGGGAPSPSLGGLGIVPVLEILYHKVGDTYELNFSRDRLEVIGEIVWLAVYNAAMTDDIPPITTPPPPPPQQVVVTPLFPTDDVEDYVDIYIHAGELAWNANLEVLTNAETRIAAEADGTFILEPGWHTVFHRAAAPYTANFHMVHTYFYVSEDAEELYIPIENSRRGTSFAAVLPQTGTRHESETHAAGTAAGAIIRLPAICDRYSPGGNWSIAAAERDSEGERLPGQTWALGSELSPWDGPNGFQTPAMRNMIFCDDTGLLTGLVNENRSLYAFTTRPEKWAFFEELVAHPVNGDNAYVFNAGFSPHNFAHIPEIDFIRNDFLVFTSTDLSDVDCWEEAGALIQENGRPTMFTYTGTHGHEQSSQEGALALAHALATTEWGVEVLEDINVVLYLGVNGTGNMQMQRRTSNVPDAARTMAGRDGQHHQDPNRDFVLQHTQEIWQLHQVWLAFMPEVTVDGHEIGGITYNADGWITTGAMGDDHQIQLTATPEVDARIVSLGSDLLQRNFDDGKDAGLRFGYYNVMIVNGSVGNHFFGLWGGISLIFETRGQTSQNLMRRTYATYTSYRSLIEFMRDNADEVFDTVAEVRADLIAAGAEYDPDVASYHRLLRDQQGGSVTAAHIENYADMRLPAISRWHVGRGGQYVLATDNHRIVTTRAVETISMPTGYIVPMEIAWAPHSNEAANPARTYAQAVAALRTLLANHQVEYFIIEPEDLPDNLPLRQYYVSSGEIVTPRHNDFTTGLRAQANIDFDVPVLFIPMDQIAAHVIGNIMTPDMRVAMREGGTVSLSWVQSLQTSGVTDTGANNTPLLDGTRTLLHHPTTMNLPIYRLTEDQPRTFMDVEDVEPDVDRAALGTALTAANARIEANYTAASWTPFAAARTAAAAVYADADATQVQVDAALAALNTAMSALETAPPPVDRAALGRVLAAANARVQAHYTAATWTPFAAARTTAAAVYADANATQAQVDAALAALNTAMNTLETVPPIVNRAALAAAIAMANAHEEADYTAATWTAFAAALAAAEAVYANANATQVQVDAALAALNTAMEALVPVTDGEEYVEYSAYMFGDGAGNFNPEDAITRAEVAAVLVRIHLRDFAATTNFYPGTMLSFEEFSDVSSDDWFYYYIAWAHHAELVQGWNGAFRPDDPVTREELAAMLVRTGIMLPAGTDEASFPDFADTSEWARKYVQGVYDEGLMVGDADTGRFRPQDDINRAETATAVNRLLGRIDSRDAWNAVEIENLEAIHPFPDVPTDEWYFPAIVVATNNHKLTRDADGIIDWIAFLNGATDE